MIVFEKESHHKINYIKKTNGEDWIPIIGVTVYRYRRFFYFAITKTDIYAWSKLLKYRKRIKKISIKEIENTNGTFVLDPKYKEYIKLLMAGVPLFTLIKERKNELCDLWKDDSK